MLFKEGVELGVTLGLLKVKLELIKAEVVLGVLNLMLLNPFEAAALKLLSNELEFNDTVPLLDTDEKFNPLPEEKDPEEEE